MKSVVAAATLIAAVTVAATGAAGYFALQHRDAVHRADDRLDYVQAARQEVVNILGVDFNSATNDVQRILDETGAWRATNSRRRHNPSPRPCRRRRW